MEKRIGQRTLSKLAIAAAVGLASFGLSKAADASLVIDIRATGLNGSALPAGSTAKDVVAAPGDVVTLQFIARVTGANSTLDDGFQAVHGAIKSSTGGLLGNLGGSFITAPFNGTSSQNGSAVDADADGDLDIGTTPNGGTAATFWIPRSNALETTSGTPVAGADPAAREWIAGGATFTVAAGAQGETFIDFLNRKNPNGTANVAYGTWNEDGLGKNAATGVISDSPVRISAGAVPEPTGLALAGLASLGLLARRRNNA
jgi:hypothetical protein